MQYYALSGLGEFDSCTRGDALRACPWLSYSAPSALEYLYARLLRQTRCSSFMVTKPDLDSHQDQRRGVTLPRPPRPHRIKRQEEIREDLRPEWLVVFLAS